MTIAPTRKNGRAAKAMSKRVRVAIYTRKSVSEGLEQQFNTLDAQRDAVEAYVRSQRGQGWTALSESYDDGGFTGANVDRPAFQRLLADVEAGKVDVVAVYKIDRLSRSLLDFAKLMEFFQARGVAFVSVTETFDTSTPIGRMVLNLLATFAQFERETTAQRTRDKVLASRRRGLWTGGRPVLGYDVVEKQLVVNESEAQQVRTIFGLYQGLGSMLPVVEELMRRSWKTKTWTNKKGDLVRGHTFNKSSVHSLLTNPLYAGKVRCNDELHDGAHAAIVDEATWDAVQTQLASKTTPERRPRRSTKNGALLAGLVRCACGSSMTSHFTTKGDRRYRYYVCDTVQKQGAAACPGSRVAAGELEAFVLERIREIGCDPKVLAATLEADRRDQQLRRPELVAESRRVVTERSKIDRERSALVDAIATSGKAAPALAERLGEKDEELRAIERHQDDVREELACLDTGTIDPDELREALGDLEPIWGELFPRERARVLTILIEEVRFDAESGEVEIAFRPGGPALLAAGDES